jgi:predicted nucleic acid-binding protein
VSVFIDTSAIFAVLDADDQNHKPARRTWAELLNQEVVLVCTNYVLLEAFALVQRRLGIEATRALQEAIAPVLHVEWVTEALHATGVSALLIAANRQLSLVDCISFEAMRRLGILTAFAFDRHFSEQGFACIPPNE